MNKITDKITSILDTKIQEPVFRMIHLGVMAGIYISFGGMLFIALTSYAPESKIFRLFGALLFTIGLNLVIFKKAQLFTGNNLMFLNIFKGGMNLSVISGIIRNWIFVYLGNFLGSILFVLFCYMLFSTLGVGESHASRISFLKTNYNFQTAFLKAIYCNVLVCIAVSLEIGFENIRYKVLGIIIPITTFVFLGFEHSIANMFMIPIGLSFQDGSLIQQITLFLSNLLPVTIGNIVGGLIVSIFLYFGSSWTFKEIS